MTKITRAVTHLILAATATLLPLAPAWAADEDMSSSVYLKFDPETGDFVTVEDPSRTQSQQHQAASKQAAPSGTGTGAAATDMQQPPAGSTARETAAPAQSETPTATPSPMIIGTVIALLALVAGAIVWVKRSPAKQAT